MEGFLLKQELAIRDVWKAQNRIRKTVQKTPLVFSHPLSDITGANIYLKLENMHETGAFKIRGAANKILSLTAEQRSKGVATFSTGNHGIAVAYLAKQLNIPATICISRRVPKEKVNKLKGSGALVEVVGDNQDDAEAFCKELEQKYGIAIIPPFDDPEIIAGQGTIGAEIMEELPEIDEAVIPLSGGGLLAGIAFFLKNVDSAINITGISMESSAVMHESLKQGQPVVLKEADTLADSLLGGIGADNRYTFSMTKKYMNQSYLVSEKSIAKGILFMAEHHKMIIEGAAAAGIGWLLKQKKLTGKNIVVIISGNNIDHLSVSALIKG